jgi:hypothetical protein
MTNQEVVDPGAILAKNKIFHRRHQGERCFILGTGPSINNQDLKVLQGEHCIAVSNFFVHPDYRIIKPYYYCIAPHHPPISEKAWQAWMTDLAAKTGDETFFFSLGDQWRVEANDNFASKNKNYLHFCEFDDVANSIMTMGIDLSSSLFSPQSVSIMALAIAIYMDFQEIYLLGCDHDWICHMNESRHFYAEHEHAMVRSGYNEWKDSSVEIECQCILNLWQQYKLLNYVANLKEIKIYNATPGGLLDVFPRVCFERLFTKEPRQQFNYKLNSGNRRYEQVALPLTPVSRLFGLDRGSPIDRYYIELFLAKNSDLIYGDVLEVEDCSYTQKFGSSKVRHSLVLDVTDNNPQATIVGDLATGEGLKVEIADCFILTQVLPFIFEVQDAVANAIKVIKPGGHLLITVPGITQISRYDMEQSGHYWSFTDISLRKMLEKVVPADNIKIETFGNVKAAAAFLYGLAQHEIPQNDLDYLDVDYQVIITAVVRKPLE